MFMFVFAVILISIVGLFLQIINALVLYFAAHQMGMGQQLFLWQNMAREYACTSGASPGVPTTGTLDTSDPAVVAGIRSIRPEYQGHNWSTVIFDGTYGSASSRIVLSYISPSGSYGGFSPGEVVRQFRGSFTNNDYQFSAVYAANCANVECMDVIVSTTDGRAIVTVSGIPASVPVGANGMISSVNCSP